MWKFILDKLGGKNYSVLEVGCGFGKDACVLSQGFKEYIAIDDAVKIKVAKNRKPKLCHIKYKDMLFEDFKEKVDVILFINSFQYMKDMNAAFEKCKNQCRYLIIKDKQIKPEGWQQGKYNEYSKEFDPEIWEEKKKLLISEHNFLISKGATYIEQPRMYYFSFKKNTK